MHTQRWGASGCENQTSRWSSAFRARHERAHARPDVDLSIRRARCLSIYDRAGGASTPTKKGLSEASRRNVRQVSRFLDDMMRDATQRADRPKACLCRTNSPVTHGQKPSTGRLFFQTRQLAKRPARQPSRQRQLEQRDTRGRYSLCKETSAAMCASSSYRKEHQPADQSRGARCPCGGLLQRQDARRPRTSSIAA